MTKKDEKKVSGAKAPEATNAEVKDNKDSKDDNEWLQEELENVDVEAKKDDAKDTDSDEALMKKAAEQLEKLTADVKEWKNNYMRLHAEWDTYRRRTAEQRQAERASACEALTTDILPVLDDFERSIDYAKNNGESGLLDGVQAVQSKLVSALTKNGTEVIDPEPGSEFNALEHQAVATVENTEMFNESIASVMQKGYKMGKKVIRPAMVSVTTGGKNRPKPKDEDKDKNKDKDKDKKE